MLDRIPNPLNGLTVALCCGIILLGMASESAAQQRDKNVVRVEQALRDGAQLRELFTPVVAKARRSMVQIAGARRRQAFGVIISADGWIVTKASEIGERPVCKLSDGRSFDARVAGVSRQHDLALLKVSAKNLTPVDWHFQDRWTVGQWLATAGSRRLPVAIGVLSNSLRVDSGKRRGFLGVEINTVTRGALIADVTPKSSADVAGLEKGDVIQRVNDKKITGRESLIEAIGGYEPDDTIQLRIYRKGKVIETKATLGIPSENQGPRGLFGRSGWRSLSTRKDGFKTWLRHDAVISSRDCGSLLVDLRGRAVGLNIARAGRTMTKALPAGVVKVVADDLIAKDRVVQAAKKRSPNKTKKTKTKNL